MSTLTDRAAISFHAQTRTHSHVMYDVTAAADDDDDACCTSCRSGCRSIRLVVVTVVGSKVMDENRVMTTSLLSLLACMHDIILKP